ncbi:Uncharacterised protein [Mycobacterium tuberculosis]|uniref:Uncharacterized protein n=1 Tax=Mycobacterium tuberculosis TaxID=1773 RepID=A0A916P6K7_MYCTX|nr:Uncharacterised protein [Mycobacterium tuberculosis]
MGDAGSSPSMFSPMTGDGIRSANARNSRAVRGGE